MAPMQYNTALCFLLAGAAMGSLVWGRVRFAQALAGGVVTIAGLTLCEDLFKADFGIDQFLFHPYITNQTSNMGRMSPVGALGLAQVGLALLLIGFRFGKKWRMLVVGSLGSIVIALSVMAILGYAIGLPGIYAWGHFTRVALHTVGGLCLLGIAIFALAWNADRKPNAGTPRWLPVPVGLSIFTASLVLWQALESKQNQEITQTVKADAENVTQQLRTRLAGRIQVLVRMAERWEFSGSPSQAAWEDEAKNHLRDNSEFQALEWIDAAHLVQWIVPLAGNEAKLHLDPTQEEHRRNAAERAERRRQPAITTSVELFHGSLGFEIYVPIYVGTKFDGWITSIFSAQSLCDRYLPPKVAAGESIHISEGGKTLYERSPSLLPAHSEWIVDSHIALPGTTWDVRVWPTPALLAQLDTPLPRIALALGFIASSCSRSPRSSRKRLPAKRGKSPPSTATCWRRSGKSKP